MSDQTGEPGEFLLLWLCDHDGFLVFFFEEQKEADKEKEEEEKDKAAEQSYRAKVASAVGRLCLFPPDPASMHSSL